MLTQAIAKSLRNLFLPGIIKLFLWCLLAYGVGWTLLAWLLGMALGALVGGGGMEGLFIQMVGAMGGGLMAWFLFPLLYPVLVSFFDEHMAEVIEREDYPGLQEATPPFWPTFGQDVTFTLKAVLINLVLLPVYFFPLIGMAVYFSVNGYLLGTQFFRMSAGRRVPLVECEQLRRKLRGSIFMGGLLVSICATVPLLNLAAPLLGVATMLHLFHMAKGHDKQQVLPPS